MKHKGNYSPEVRERAIRMLREQRNHLSIRTRSDLKA